MLAYPCVERVEEVLQMREDVSSPSHQEVAPSGRSRDMKPSDTDLPKSDLLALRVRSTSTRTAAEGSGFISICTEQTPKHHALQEAATYRPLHFP